MFKSMMTLLVATQLLACSSQLGGAAPESEPTRTNQAPARTADAPPNGATSTSQAPFVAELRGPSEVAANSHLDLELVIERNVVNDVPMVISARLPPGVTLEAGSLSESIVDGKQAKLVRPIRIAIGQVPTSDLDVSIDVKGSNYGAHATATYRFGRAAPKLPNPSNEKGPRTSPWGAPIMLPGH
jgi:hypothetical protein